MSPWTAMTSPGGHPRARGRTKEEAKVRGDRRSRSNGGRESGARSSATGADLSGHWGRDVGAVSTRNTSKGALVAEAHAVFRALASGKALDEVRSACLTGRLLLQSARETRHRIWGALDWRYFAWSPPRWVLAELAEAAKGDVTDRRFVGLAYLPYARRDRLTFDFVTDRLWSRWKSKALKVRRDDVLDFLADRIARRRGQEVAREHPQEAGGQRAVCAPRLRPAHGRPAQVPAASCYGAGGRAAPLPDARRRGFARAYSARGPGLAPFSVGAARHVARTRAARPARRTSDTLRRWLRNDLAAVIRQRIAPPLVVWCDRDSVWLLGGGRAW